MKTFPRFLLLTACAAVAFATVTSAVAADKIRVLLVTGGHAFERPQFFKIFEDNTEITFKSVEHPNPKEGPKPDPMHPLLKPDAAKDYDVIVLYDMWQPITDEAQGDLVNLLKAGKGLVALHHCLASYQAWDEYAKIIGGKYWLKDRGEGSAKKPHSTYKHGMRFTVHIADPKHPVTKGMKDFEIFDETYGGFEVKPGVKALLTTDEPTSGKTIGWAKTYGKSRVVYIELGHDHLAYENPNYQRLIAQAIKWTAGK
ncbi:MAG: ThuA domain-containing protein [Verrucomicrobia bacterium]|nr:ThuA domain-containing protein [Verrucomicrobiota bacterium]